MNKKDKKNKLYAVCSYIVWAALHLVYRCDFNGTEKLLPRGEKVILCSNHLSASDPVFLALAGMRRQIFYMAKAELFHKKFPAFFIRQFGAFPVERGTGGADALAEARHKLQDEGCAVGIFIEGTRSKTGELLKPKIGAAVLAYETQTPVIPVCITTKNCHTPGLFTRVVVTFGDPIRPEEFGITEGSGVELRRLSRTIMERIAAMREQDLKKFK